ncbi:MAG: hypothetical protein WKG06_09225 [Segetibacter sp.]
MKKGFQIVSNPFARIILGLLVCFGVVIIGQEIAGKILALTGLDKDYRNLVKGIIVSLLAISSYSTFFKFIEKRTITEISTNGIEKNLAMGTFIGVVLQCLTILVIYSLIFAVAAFTGEITFCLWLLIKGVKEIKTAKERNQYVDAE